MKTHKRISEVIAAAFPFALAAMLCTVLFFFSGWRLPLLCADETVLTITDVTYEKENIGGKLTLPTVLKNLPPRTLVTLNAQIPPGQGSLYVKSVFAETKLYINGVLTYEFGQAGSYTAFMNDPPTGIAIVPLPQSAEDVSIRIEYISPSQRRELSIPVLYTGNEGAIIATLFRANGFSLLFSLILIFIGMAISAISLAFLRKMTDSASFLWLGLFSLSAGVWVLGECDLSAFLIPYPQLLYAMAYLGLFSVTIPFLRFGLVILKPKNKLPILVMLYTHYIALTAALLLQLAGAVDLMKTLYLFHVIAPLAFIVFAADLLWEYFHHCNQSAERFAPAVIMLAVAVEAELINYWLGLIGSFTVMFQLGVLAFIIALGVESGRSIAETMKTAAEKLRLEYEINIARETEQILSSENAALDRLNLMKTDLMATISHETRTPLAVISNYAELIAMGLRRKGVDEQTASDLDKISDEILRISGIMEEIQKFSRVKDRSARKERMQLADLINQSARLYAPILERKNTKLFIDIPEDLPMIFANTGELTQVLFNLLQNARNHTENGMVRIGVSTSDEDGELEIVVTVSDTGTGVAPEFLPQAFERYAHVDPEGTGIGLSICREVVEEHGGSIEIDSVQGHGTVVRFVLPINGEDNEDGQKSFAHRGQQKTERDQSQGAAIGGL